MTTAEEVSRLIDRQTMNDALVRYCRGADRCDGALMAQLFHPDATIHHAAFRGNAHEFVSEYVGRIKASATFAQHAIANVLIEFDGHAARSETSFVAYLGREREGGELLDVFGGRYLDRWERREAGWRVADRTTVHDWHTVVLRGDVPFPRPIDAYAQGGWAPDDPSYEAFGGLARRTDGPANPTNG